MFPAPAGMNRRTSAYADRGARVPRACGDEPDAEADTLADLPLDEFIRLAVALIESNWDFFVHRLLPEMEQAMNRLAPLWMAGTPSVTDSPPTDTPDGPDTA